MRRFGENAESPTVSFFADTTGTLQKSAANKFLNPG
jgi:hypothetical protein